MKPAGHFCARARSAPSSMTCFSSTCLRIEILCYYKCRILPEPPLLQIRARGPNQNQFSMPTKSSFREQACKRSTHAMDDERWSNRNQCSSFSSAQTCTEESEVMKQVQDWQPSNQAGGACVTGLSHKEIERRRKIGAANKGKAPWTKGRKLSTEHKQLIKRRTIEALRDPKVKKKMLGHRQLHRQVSKDKISAALQKIWERRIVSVRSKQTVLRIWSNSIAQAAKEGDHSQDKLNWDSHDKIKSQMISMFLWNKEKERIINKLKRAVKKIVAKKLEAAQRRELQARRAMKSKPEKLVLHKSDAQLTSVVVSTRSKIKERLTKWHGRKKELETVINLRTRKGGGLRKPLVRCRVVERRSEVDLVEQHGVASGRLKELHLTCKDDGLPRADN